MKALKRKSKPVQITAKRGKLAGEFMEDMLWKFPYIGQKIFKKLSNHNLAKCKKVAKTWEHFIINENFYKQKVKYETKQKEKEMD